MFSGTPIEARFVPPLALSEVGSPSYPTRRGSSSVMVPWPEVSLSCPTRPRVVPWAGAQTSSSRPGLGLRTHLAELSRFI